MRVIDENVMPWVIGVIALVCTLGMLIIKYV